MKTYPDPVIVFRRFRYSQFASHETHCYESFVDVDGHTILAENSGQGGSDNYSPVDTSARARHAYRCAMWNLSRAASKRADLQDFDEETQVECVIGDALDKFLVDRQLEKLKTKFQKNMATHVFFLMKGKIYFYNRKRPLTTEDFGYVQNKHPAAVILNEMEFEKAWSIYAKDAQR